MLISRYRKLSFNVDASNYAVKASLNFTIISEDPAVKKVKVNRIAKTGIDTVLAITWCWRAIILIKKAVFRPGLSIKKRTLRIFFSFLYKGLLMV